MARCKNCGVEILDDTEKCPLCNLVLEKNNKPTSDLYPEDVREFTRRYRTLSNIILFLSIVIETIALGIEFVYADKIIVSVVTGLILIYVNVIMRLAVMGKSGYMFKILGMVIIALAMLVSIDFAIGYRGWSIEFILPIAVIIVDITLLLLMMINRRNWQSYIMFLMLQAIVGIVLVVLAMLNVIHWPYLVVVAAGLSFFEFIGTVIIGDQRARTELKRRFHV